MRFVFLLRPPASRSIPCCVGKREKEKVLSAYGKRMNTNAFRRGSSLLRKESGTHAKCARSRGRERTDERTRGMRERRTLSQGGADRPFLRQNFLPSAKRAESLSRVQHAPARLIRRVRKSIQTISKVRKVRHVARDTTVTPLARGVFTRTFFRRKIALSLCLFARILSDAKMMHHHPRLLQRRKR